MENSKPTPLYESHLRLGGKMIEFAGYKMPIQYSLGLAKEHLWVRSSAGLFDVSHMGQAILEGEGAADFLSVITPSPFAKTPVGNAKYTVLTNENGGIIDDLIITRIAEEKFFLVFNAARKNIDEQWLKKHMPAKLQLTMLKDRALMALQGRKAEAVLSRYIAEPLSDQEYMSLRVAHLHNGEEIFVSRLGYTGEDGFEISIAGDKAIELWDKLIQCPEVEPIGLGARNSLRLEMGYPLYGHDLNEQTSPIEANLSWVVSKKNTNFMGANRILQEREQGPNILRVGVMLTDKGIAREGAPILNKNGEKIGTLTSGGLSPSLNKAIGQGYVDINYSHNNTEILVQVRNKKLAATVTNLSFIEARTKTKKRKQAA